MNKKIVTIEIEVKDWLEDDVEVGDYVDYKDEVYIFEGYEYGLHPIGKHIITKEQIQLPQ